jgi:hypothetical protein
VDLGKGAARWVTDQVALAKERERLRIENRIAGLTDIDDRARQLMILRRHKPGYSWHQHIDEERLKIIGLAAAAGDEELTALLSPFMGDSPDPSDDEYAAVAARLAALKSAAFAPPE